MSAITKTTLEAVQIRQAILIDGTGYIFRAFHALPPMTRPDGVPVNAVYGFTTMLMRFLEDSRVGYRAVIFDASRQTFRNNLYPDYKAHRPPLPDDLVPQLPLIREAVRVFNVMAIEQEGYEADDLIATYARAAVAEEIAVMIFSADKDLMQLVGPGIALWDPLKSRTIGPDQVREKFGVDPTRVVDVQALAGDPTDNVPGVPGIGIKTAADLITRFGDLDNLLAEVKKVIQPKRRQALIDYAEDARLSRALVRLKDDVPVIAPLAALATQPLEPEAVRDFLQAQGFRSLLARFGSRFQSPGAAPSAIIGTVAAGDRAPVPSSLAYSPVQSLEDLDRWLVEARAAGIVAVDTKTDSSNSLTAQLMGVFIAFTANKVCYITLDNTLPSASQSIAHAGTEDVCSVQIPTAEALERLRREILENRGVLKVGHNIKFDSHVFHTAGQRSLGRPIVVAPVDDTMVLSYVLDGSKTSHDADELAAKHLGLTTISHKAMYGTDKIMFDQVPLDRVCGADVTLRLYLTFRERLRAERMMTVHETLDRPLISVLTAMERAGILVDAAELQDLSVDFTARMTALEADIHRLAGICFNVGSPKQLGEVIFDHMGLPGGKKSAKSGAYGTDAVVLESLAARGHNMPARVLEWRHLAKLKNTYTEALITRRDKKTGRIHTSFAQTMTTTGRLSSNNPNLQNIPVRTEDGRRIRRTFVAPDGHMLLSADYSQIELRLLAHIAGVEALKEAFSVGVDIHAATASQVFGVPGGTMNPALRRQAKAINFGIIYGISPFGLAAQLGVSQSEAKAFIEAYFARYPEIRTYTEQTKARAHIRGFVTTPFGRRCQIPGINDRNANTRSFAERAAINAPIQGGAADIIKRAMIRLSDALAEAGMKTRILLQVHDELVFEIPEAELSPAATLINSVMEKAAVLSVPLVVNVGVGRNWAEAH